MSFSYRTKEELCKIRIKRPCCALAALSAWIQMAGSLQIGSGQSLSLRLVTESYAVARWGISLAKSNFALQSEIHVHEQRRLGKSRSFAIFLRGDCIQDLLVQAGILLMEKDGSIGMQEAIHKPLIQEECCRRSFLRGAFLGSASISNPQKGYHLEFVMRNETLSQSLCGLLNEYTLNAKIVLRKGFYVVYLKEGEKITELLTLIGAYGAILELENVRVMKGFRNNLNRQVNCETGNIQKTVTAAGRQIENIRYLIECDKLRFLGVELRETAEARVNHPEATLAELGQLLSIPVGKSGVNHRLRKLDELAEALKLEKGDA